jgi:Ca2+-binding RTX toxin-like protein
VFNLMVQVTDDGAPTLSDVAQITVSLSNVVESPVSVSGSDVLVFGTPASDTIYLWRFLLPAGGRVVVHAGDGNDQVYATDLRISAVLFGEGGHDQMTGGKSNDTLDGGDGVDRLWGGPGDDLIRGGAGNDVLSGREGNDILLGGAGNDWIEGHVGNDILIGGSGRDQVGGGEGEDLLIGGTTSYDDSDSALESLLAAWAGQRDFPARRASLADDLQWGMSVQDDGEPDALVGGIGADWYFAMPGDAVYASDADEVTANG